MRIIFLLIATLASCTSSPRSNVEYPEYANEGNLERASPYMPIVSNYPPPIPGEANSPTAFDEALAYAEQNSGRASHDFLSFGSGYSVLSNFEWERFFLQAQPTAFPGICENRAYTVSWYYAEGGNVFDGEWEDPVYCIVGSTAPRPTPWPDSYRSEFTEICNARLDANYWVRGTSAEQLALHARLSELVIHAARRDGSLPFSLQCAPLPDDLPYTSRCADNVRFTVASINPQTIVGIDDCYFEDERSTENCYGIAFPKAPDSPDSIESEHWQLQIVAEFPDRDGERIPMIKSVAVFDSSIIIE